MEIRQTEDFRIWLAKLKDRRAAFQIARRIDRASIGHLGDVKTVGGRVSEMRIAFGPGYRVYFTRRGNEIIILLCAGSKRTQGRDIEKAQEMVRHGFEDHEI